jgi:hypothetical protein
MYAPAGAQRVADAQQLRLDVTAQVEFESKV